MTEIFCPWEPSTYLFFSSNVPDLVHYSHGTAIFSALIIALIVYASNPRNIISKLFLGFSLLFSLWATLDMILWATNNPSVVMFSWALQVLLEPLIYVVAFYLFYIYVTKRWPSFKYNLLFFIALLPLVLFLHTPLNLPGLLLESCESIEGPLAMYYSYFVNLLALTFILITGIRFIPNMSQKNEKLSSFFFGLGLVTFLFSFTFGNIISSFSDDWTISQYGLFAMPIFALVISYNIVKFKAFNIRTVGAQVLVIVLWFLVGSLLLVAKSATSILISALTLVFTVIAGVLLIKGVRKEVKQREQIEQLVVGLERANERLQVLDKQKSEFVSIASHQLRSPLTAIRGYVSMMSEGSFGKLPDKATEALGRIQESTIFMA